MEEKTLNPSAQLAAAYAKAYGEIQNVVKNAQNPHFKSDYATLDAVLDTVKPVFAKYDLAVFQAPGELAELGGQLIVTVHSVLMHSSGAAMPVKTQLPIGAKTTAQGAGGAITYARRYALAAIAGIHQVDDDGNEASNRGGRGAAAVDIEGLKAQIAACTALGEEGSEEPTELESLRTAVTESGSKELVDAFMSKRKSLRGKGKKS